MKLFRKFFDNTLIGKFVNMIKWTWDYIQSYEYASGILYSDDFEDILYRYLNVHFKKDWLGRLYGVINPNIDINGKINFNNVVIEIDDDNTNNNNYVKQWVYKQMSMVQAIIEARYGVKMDAFFELIGVEFAHVGPKNADNYLVVFDIVSRKEMDIYFKKFIKHLFVYVAIIGAYCLYNYLK